MSRLQQPPTTRVSLPVLALLLAALFFSTAYAATPTLTRAQKQALVAAWHAGYHYGLPDTFAAVVFVESSACRDAVESSAHAYGCSQVKQEAVKAVTGIHIPAWQLLDPALQDENMAIGAKYLSLCIQRFGYPEGIACYYQGPSAASKKTRAQLRHFWYTRAVLAALVWIKQLPTSEE